MDSALTRTQFALQALVAAGYVTQAKVDQALALFSAPAGEPEIPEPDTHCFDDDAGKDVWSHSPHQLRAYGDARAEHARRVAMEDAAKLVAAARYAIAAISHIDPDFAKSPLSTAARAVRGLESAIRAAAPPQGEQT